MSRYVKIAGMGKYLPTNTILSSEVEKELGLEGGWIYKTSGVRKRNFVDFESAAYMGARALEEALEKAEMDYSDLDLIVNASGSFDQPIPNGASLIQRELGKGDSGTPCLDIDSTCLSFVTAFDNLSYLIDAERYNNIAIISSEISSKSLNPNEKESFTLLGDGAAAAIISSSDDDDLSRVLTADFRTFSNGADYTCVKGGGNSIHPNDKNGKFEDYTFHMQGKKVLEMTFEKLPKFINNLFDSVGLEVKDLDLFIPHQASKIGLDIAKRFLNLKDDQFMSIIEDHGNCIAASIPMALYDAISENRVKRGDKVCLAGTSAGLSLGALIFIY